MRFHGALGNVQIASDFRVVTSLEQQLDNLPLPWPYFLELLFHRNQHRKLDLKRHFTFRIRT